MNKLFVYFIAFVAAALFLGMLAAEYSPTLLISAMVGVTVFMVAFLNSEVALYILIFSMLLSPEFMAGATVGKELERGVTLRLDDFLLLVIGLSWLARTAVHKDLGLFLRTPLNKPIFYYLAACTVSTGFGIMTGTANPKTGFFFVLKYFEYFLVYFMAVNHLETKEQLNRLIYCLFLTCLIVSVYGMLQIPGGGRVSAPFEGEVGEPNTFGGYLVFIGAVAMGIYLHIDNKKIKRLLILLIVAIFPSFLFTESRSSYLAAIPAVLFLVYTSKRRLYFTIILIAGLLASPLFLPHIVKQRILFTFTQPKESGQINIGGVKLDTSTSARLDSWRNGLKAWSKRPIFGYGVTGYAFMDAQFPRVLVETGIVGLYAFIYLLYSIYRLALNNFKKLKVPLNQGIAIGFFAGYIGLLFHAIGANTFIIVRIMEPFWLMAGIVAVLPDLESSEKVKAAEING